MVDQYANTFKDFRTLSKQQCHVSSNCLKVRTVAWIIPKQKNCLKYMCLLNKAVKSLTSSRCWCNFVSSSWCLSRRCSSRKPTIGTGTRRSGSGLSNLACRHSNGSIPAKITQINVSEQTLKKTLLTRILHAWHSSLLSLTKQKRKKRKDTGEKRKFWSLKWHYHHALLL